MCFKVNDVYELNQRDHKWVDIRLWTWGARFGISFKLLLITCVGVFLQGWNTLTCHRKFHLGESASVEFPIVWHFIDCMDSWATFTVFFKMAPYAYKFTSLMATFTVWTFDLYDAYLLNLIVCKCILFLYGFLKVLNVLWDVSHSPYVCLICVWTEYHPCRWIYARL